ncbi:MAG: hypothetical protein VX613_02855 [Candidatus Thermoplasmatota archaeon]|nr:hypothetical protein [Candidatus Thermoplasmatota archaeon]
MPIWPFTSGKNDNEYGLGSKKNLSTDRHEMLRDSLFGETPILVIEDSQPLVLTHEMIKRSVENLGFEARGTGPSLIESKDGWEQIGGDFSGERYGVWVSPSKLKKLGQASLIFLILGISSFVLGVSMDSSDYYDEDDYYYEGGTNNEDNNDGMIWLIIGVTSLLISLGIYGYITYLKIKMKKSEIKLQIIYMGFRKEKNNRKKLGKPLLDSIIKDLGEENERLRMPNLSSFLDGISDFDNDKSSHGKLQLSITYSLHTKLNSNQPVLERDFSLLRDGLLQSMVVSTKEFTPIFKEPQFIHTETQIHQMESEFSTLRRFPVKMAPTTDYQNTKEPFSDKPSVNMNGSIFEGMEWISHMGKDWYRQPNSGSEWILHKSENK